MTQTEPYSKWMNAIEVTIKEIKKGSGRKIIAIDMPKLLWENYIKV